MLPEEPYFPILATALFLVAGAALLFLVAVLGQRRWQRRQRTMEEARYRALVETAVDPIVTIDARGLVQTFNSAAERTFGFAADEVIGRNVAMLMPEPDRSRHDGYLYRYHQTGMRHIIGVGREVRGRRRDGSTFPLDLSVGEWKSDGRTFFTGIMRDITERKLAEDRFRLLMREVDHRAKNALSAVQAIVRLSQVDDPKAYAQAIEGRIAAIARAHSLLAASHWSGADLRHLVEGELAPFQAGTRLQISGALVSIRAEAAQAVSMVLHELTVNAAKYGALSRSGGTVSVTWRPSDTGPELVIDWREAGGPPIHRPPQREGFGTKLLVSTIEAQLHGNLEREWRAEGLQVRLRLPPETWTAEAGAAAPAEGVADELSSSTGARQQVLLVEDEALTALALQDVLEAAGYEVLGPAGRVEDALALVRRRRPDAAVLDVNLYGETVEPVAVALREMSVPFVFCTGYHDIGIPRAGAEAPVLHKPVDAGRLLKTVGALVH